jgi:MFS family permease
MTTRLSKFSLLASLYVTQYLPIGFFFIAMPAILRSVGFSLEQIGMFYVVALPWVIKVLWAPLIDRYSLGRLGHYRGWLLLMQSLMVLSLLAMVPLSIQHHFGWIVFGALVYAALSATQDIAADALSVQILSPAERGLGNGIQMAGGFLGSLVGGGLTLVVYDWFGWSGIMLALAAVLALPLVQVWLYREQTATLETRAAARYRDVFSFFRQLGMGQWMLILLLIYLASSLLVGLIQPLLIDKGWELARIGFVVNILANAVGIAGAMLTGVVIHRLGRKRALLLSFSVMALAMIGFLPIVTGPATTWLVVIVMSCFYVVYALSAGCVSTLCMDRCRPHCGGSDFTVQHSLSSVLGLVASGAGVALAGSVGYSAVILAAVALAAVTSLLIAWLLPGGSPAVVALPVTQFGEDRP